MTPWQAHIAKSRFGELLQKAECEGPQVITRYGGEIAVVVSAESYRRFGTRKLSFKEYLLSAPKFDSFDIPRDSDGRRETEL